MEKLSVIIVSYNAKYYLNLTLISLSKIAEKRIIEVIVVDNNSILSEIEFNKSKFPNVNFILNKENIGFSKANNLGVKIACHENILILNPDTIISESVIKKALEKLHSDRKIGAVSIKMLDGNGEFLPESIRTFPDFKSSIFKFLGLKSYTNYYQGLSYDNTVDVMSGACIFFKKSIYDEIGGFDERYFMYGEDIDISYQLKQKGYVAKYIDEHEIIHFKGKSSVKSNWKYQQSFYNAMYLYWDKNFNLSKSSSMQFLMSSLIFGLKILSYIKHTLSLIFLPIIDFTSILLASCLFSYFWVVFYKHDLQFLPSTFYIFILPLYTISAIFSFFVCKLYSDEFDIYNLLKGAVINGLFILIIYFILPIDFKYSRAVLIYCSIISLIVPFIIRFIYTRIYKTTIQFSNSQLLITSIIPNNVLIQKIIDIISRFSNFNLIFHENDFTDKILDISQLSNEEIIDEIKSNNYKSNLWFFSELGNYLVKSHGKNSNGYIIAKDMNFLNDEIHNRFLKSGLDLILVFLILPFSFFTIHRFIFVLNSCFKVLIKNYTWVDVQNINRRNSIFKIPQDESNDYQRNYSLKQDLYYFYRFMFIS